MLDADDVAVTLFRFDGDENDKILAAEQSRCHT